MRHHDAERSPVISIGYRFYFLAGHENLVNSSMADFLRDLPKAELHLHLEGSVEPETLYELDPPTSIEEYRALYRYTDFDAFLRVFGVIGKRLRTPEDYALIRRRPLERLAPQNVRYAEIIVAAGVGLWKSQGFASSV